MKIIRSIDKAFLYSMVTLAIISIGILGSLIVSISYKEFDNESEELRKRYIDGQKEIIKNEVEKVIDYIEYMKSLTEKRLKYEMKNRTKEAYSIAMNLYFEKKDIRSRSEIEKAVKDALRPIRFNNGRGYYFATNLEGVEQLFSDKPELEGVNLINMRDTKGKYVIKDMIEIVKKRKEGFYRYNWSKPNVKGKDFPKIAYIKHFEPFDWFIGTGEYLDDVEKDIKDEILERIGKIRFGKEGYIFVVDFDGVTLMNDTQRRLIGKNLWEMTDPNGVKVIQEERKAVENPDGGFINYVWNKPTEAKPVPKISFIKGVHEWRWMVGAGVYVDEIDKVIELKKVSLESAVKYQVSKIVLILVLLLTFVYILARYISTRIKKNFDIFSLFFQKAATESIKIEQKELHFSEFKNLAFSANRMIDHREQAEKLLKESEEKYRTLFNMESDALALVDMETGKVIDANKSFVDLHGYSKEEILNMKYTEFSAETDQTKKAKQSYEKFVPARYHKKRDGTVFPVEINAGVFEYQGKDVHLAAIRDISDRMNLESQLRHAQKMESIGTLAGGIAHDFNNILSPIMVHSEMAMMDLPADNPVQHNLKEIFKAGERARDMVKQILTFSRKREGGRAAIKISPILTEVLKMLRASIPTTIDIQQNMEAESDTVLADPTQIHQILLNLGTNAAHAMREKGGTLKVSLVQENFDSDTAARYPDLNPGPYLKLTVSDSGSGIDDETIKRIFEPYFTTKGLGEGTGMGLALVHGIVKSYGGDITVESESGKGTTFNVCLPRIAGDVSPVEEPLVQLPRGNERILFIDDEKGLVDAIQPMLESLGYRVTARTSSIEALEAFRNKPDAFDLVVTDMTMPNMTGKELAKELLQIRPDIPIILCTGFSEQVDEKGAMLLGIRSFLMKPVVMREIAIKMREVLD